MWEKGLDITMTHGVWTHNTICQLAIIGAAFGQQIVNVHHFEAGGVLEGTFLNDSVRVTEQGNLIASWNTSIKTAWLAMLPADYSLIMLRAQVLEVPNLRAHRLTPTETAGTGIGTAVGLGTAEVTSPAGNVKWRTPVAGKSHRGRTFVGPLSQNAFSNGLLAAGAVTLFDAYRTAMGTTFVQTVVPRTGWTLTIYSRPYDYKKYGYVKGKGPDREFFFPEEYDGNSTMVTASATDAVVRSQRRRQIGVGA